MNRELKVKAWLKDAKCFAEVRHISFFEGNTVIKIYDQPMSEEIWFDLEELELLQYTGLKDKNGVEIYEGDILKINSPEGVFLGKVVHEIATYGIAAIKGQIIDYFPDNWNDDYLTLLDIYWNNNDDDEMVDSVEIIGNIYENPELLEGSAE